MELQKVDKRKIAIKNTPSHLKNIEAMKKLKELTKGELKTMNKRQIAQKIGIHERSFRRKYYRELLNSILNS